MRREDWAARLTDTIAAEVRRLRENRRMTAQQLVDAVNDLGLPMKRSVLTNLEHGRRGNVTIAELLALAQVLGVAPVELIFPVGRTTEAEPLPGRTTGTWDAAQWFTGEYRQAGDDGAPAAVELFRAHTQHFRRWEELARRARTTRRAADMAPLESDQREMRARADRDDARARAELQQLRVVRQQMRQAGLTPPALADAEVGPALQLQLDEVDAPGGLS